MVKMHNQGHLKKLLDSVSDNTSAEQFFVF